MTPGRFIFPGRSKRTAFSSVVTADGETGRSRQPLLEQNEPVRPEGFRIRFRGSAGSPPWRRAPGWYGSSRAPLPEGPSPCTGG
jgi:hypothetical protein